MADAASLSQELTLLEAELKRLEAEYNMFFAGRLPRPPWETRTRVQGIVKRIDRMSIPNYGERFRFSTLQARLTSFTDLWDRGLRAREEGRSGPFMAPPKAEPAPPPPKSERPAYVTTLTDPLQEMDKLHDLYDRLTDARRAAGQEPVAFHRFADMLKQQVSTLKAQGSSEVAFKVAVEDGKVKFTARALKGGK